MRDSWHGVAALMKIAVGTTGRRAEYRTSTAVFILTTLSVVVNTSFMSMLRLSHSWHRLRALCCPAGSDGPHTGRATALLRQDSTCGHGYSPRVCIIPS